MYWRDTMAQCQHDIKLRAGRLCTEGRSCKSSCAAISHAGSRRNAMEGRLKHWHMPTFNTTACPFFFVIGLYRLPDPRARLDICWSINAFVCKHTHHIYIYIYTYTRILHIYMTYIYVYIYVYCIAYMRT